MSNGDDVLDNWEEIDEAGLCMTLQTKLQTANDDDDTSFKPASKAETAAATATSKMKLLQRPQSLQENSGGSGSGSGSTATAIAVAPKQIMIAKKQPASTTSGDDESSALAAPPVMMVLHKSNSEYDAANYATPISNQTVKILRRPAQAEERRDTNGIRPKQPIKTLQQREQEYAQARLRILGSAKNPEDDKPAAPATLVVLSTQVQPEVTTSAPTAFNFNNNINNNGSGIQSVSNATPGMHRSTSAPKMSQTAAPIYNNYNNYYHPPTNATAMGYFYQQTPSMHQPHQHQQQQQQHQQQQPPHQHQQTSPQSLAHYNHRLSQYMTGATGGAGGATANPQQSWSPVVGGSVSAALLRQQSLHTPSLQQHQAQQQPPPPQYAHAYNDNVLRLPRGPCPNGTIGFQMRR